MDLKELNPDILEKANGGTPEEAEKYIRSLYEKYTISTNDELVDNWTRDERARYPDILLDSVWLTETAKSRPSAH